mgnify:CR=1 FL=1
MGIRDRDYMARHGATRARPAELVPGTLRVISARMDYQPRAAAAEENLADVTRAYVSRYALGRDYHKLMRNRLRKLASRIETCLLYTSPSPRDRTRSRMPSSA